MKIKTYKYYLLLYSLIFVISTTARVPTIIILLSLPCEHFVTSQFHRETPQKLSGISDEFIRHNNPDVSRRDQKGVSVMKLLIICKACAGLSSGTM